MGDRFSARALLGCIAVVLAAAGCSNSGGDASDTTSSTTTASTTTVAAPPTTIPAEECDPVVTTPIGGSVQVIYPDGVGCAEAVGIVTRYYSPDTLTEGDGAYADIDGWTCSSSSGNDAEATGVAGSCEHSDGRRIEMRTVAAPAGGPGAGAAAVAFFQSTEALCAAHAGQTSNPTVPPGWFADAVAVEELADGEWLIQDGGGHQLVVNEGRGVVYSSDGPTAELPLEYSFGCPEDVYLGTLSD